MPSSSRPPLTLIGKGQAYGIKHSPPLMEGFWKGLVKDEVSITGKKDDDDEDEEMMSETTGFSQLLPEQYVEVRLKPQILFYQEKLPSTNQYFEVGQFLVYIFSAMGVFCFLTAS